MNIQIQQWLASCNEAFTFFITFPALIALGFYITWKLKAIQITKFFMSFRSLLHKEETQTGSISHYEAVSAVLAGNFGTGNISGMAVAVATGGPGALVWMWVMAFFGAAVQYASCVLGVKYRTKNADGEYVGGPMYYLKEGLGFKKLACFFSVVTILGAITVGNLAQVNSLSLPLEKIGVYPLLCGILIAFFVGLVILGGMQRFAKIASKVVPIMASIYLGTVIVILTNNFDKILPAFSLMFQEAFQVSSITGGALGFGIVKAISSGFDRGLFATDAGTGIVPILQSTAKTNNPVTTGLCTLVAPFLVMIVCTATGLVLITTGVWQDHTLQSTNMVTSAFQKGLQSDFGGYIVVISLILFAYTTILAWGFCLDKAIEYLFGKKRVRAFQYAYIAIIPIGTCIHVSLVWTLADICISLMLFCNMVAIAFLAKEVIRDTQAYFQEETITASLSHTVGMTE